MKDVHEVLNAVQSVIDCQNNIELLNNRLNLLAPESDKTITINTQIEVRAKYTSKFTALLTIDEMRYILRKRIEEKEEELVKANETYESLWK